VQLLLYKLSLVLGSFSAEQCKHS